MNLRLDRMRRITPLSQKARPVEEVSAYQGRFDTADYAAKMFNMFSGETATVRLLCKLDTLEEMVDRFGTAIPIHAVDGDHFETTISAAVSEGMVSWLMQYGGRVQVLEPQSLIDSVRPGGDGAVRVCKKNRIFCSRGVPAAFFACLYAICVWYYC